MGSAENAWSNFQPTHMARIVPAILLHFLHPWRLDVASAEKASSDFPPWNYAYCTLPTSIILHYYEMFELMWDSIIPALALVLVIEGMLPFLSPKNWRDAMSQAAQLPDNVLRGLGFASMMAGLVILYFVQ